MERRSVMVHASASASAAPCVSAREGAEVRVTGSARAHETVKAGIAGGDGGNRQGLDSVGGQGEYRRRDCTQEGG